VGAGVRRKKGRWCSTTGGPAPRKPWFKLVVIDEDAAKTPTGRGCRNGLRGAGHVVANQATWWTGKALAAGVRSMHRLYGRIAAGAENPGKKRHTTAKKLRGGERRVKGSDRRVWWSERLLDGVGDTVIATTIHELDESGGLHRGRCTAIHDPPRRRTGRMADNMASTPHRCAGPNGSATEQSERLDRSRRQKRNAQTPTCVRCGTRVAGDRRGRFALELEMKVLCGKAGLIGGTVQDRRPCATSPRACTWLLPGLAHAGVRRRRPHRLKPSRRPKPWVPVGKPSRRGTASQTGARADRGWTRGTGLIGTQRRDVSDDERSRVDNVFHRRDGRHACLRLRGRVQGAAPHPPPTRRSRFDLTGGSGRRPGTWPELAATKAREQATLRVREASETVRPRETIDTRMPRRSVDSPAPRPSRGTTLDRRPRDLVVNRRRRETRARTARRGTALRDGASKKRTVARSGSSNRPWTTGP